MGQVGMIAAQQANVPAVGIEQVDHGLLERREKRGARRLPFAGCERHAGAVEAPIGQPRVAGEQAVRTADQIIGHRRIVAMPKGRVQARTRHDPPANISFPKNAWRNCSFTSALPWSDCDSG
jgi:hypothetical protein